MNNPVLYVMSAGMTVGVFMSLVFYSLALVISMLKKIMLGVTRFG